MNAPVKSYQRLPRVVRFDPAELKRALGEVEGFNAKLALLITRSVGTMACAYLFTLLALVSLPAILIQADVLTDSDVPIFFTKPGLILIVSWVAQTFLQLVLLSIIMVGQSVQSAASDARAAKEFTDTETILDRLDTHTAGGVRDVLDAIQAITKSSDAPPAGPKNEGNSRGEHHDGRIVPKQRLKAGVGLLRDLLGGLIGDRNAAIRAGGFDVPILGPATGSGSLDRAGSSRRSPQTRKRRG